MRVFLTALVFAILAPIATAQSWQTVDDFERADSPYHGDRWETLNPGYWSIDGGALRRRLHNRGDKARSTGFPYHWETHEKKPMPVEYDPSLPFGMIWRRDWKLEGNYAIAIDATVHGLPPASTEYPEWKQHQSGYGLFGVCFGGASLFESWYGGGAEGDASWMALIRDDGRTGIYSHTGDDPPVARAGAETGGNALESGEQIRIELHVEGESATNAQVRARFTRNGQTTELLCEDADRASLTNGHFGIVGRGLLDVAIQSIQIEPGTNRAFDAPINDLHTCYALGDTLVETGGVWRCKFVAMFRSGGEKVQLRIADTESPDGGWERVAVAGEAMIVSNEFRLNTAIVEASLPFSPAEKTLYYTVWKDGADVTADPRTGYLGRKQYVGRLPRLAPPYRVCGLGCHAIHGGNPELPRAARFQEHWVHEQPTMDAYRHIEEYGFQTFIWEDDVWYLELLLYPPSLDDAYKIVTTTIAGPTGRWVMMRHWNVLNPGDHDHGMDDVKGPEQILIRQHGDLGQDPEYMRRNFQMVDHLMQGDEAPSGTNNPKRWRRWKYPNRDFSILITDARLWRTSQDTRIWDDEGWGHKSNLYDRTDPTRTLLGEEQFAWLTQMVRTDSSPLICVTGLNCLHTIWGGFDKDPETGRQFSQRDRVAADYAGWVKAGTDRVIELLGSRQGIISVFGDIHLASIVQNREHRLYECSFGPIGRTGARPPKEDFGPEMTDYDGRPVRVYAAYLDKFETPNLRPLEGPKSWNFLEMEFDPRHADPQFKLKIRNLVDPPMATPRGGGHIEDTASNTGRKPASTLPAITTLPNADVLITTRDGVSIRGTRSQDTGELPSIGLIDIPEETPVVVTSTTTKQAASQWLSTK